jgi:hypothetical protein
VSSGKENMGEPFLGAGVVYILYPNQIDGLSALLPHFLTFQLCPQLLVRCYEKFVYDAGLNRLRAQRVIRG